MPKVSARCRFLRKKQCPENYHLYPVDPIERYTQEDVWRMFRQRAIYGIYIRHCIVTCSRMPARALFCLLSPSFTQWSKQALFSVAAAVSGEGVGTGVGRKRFHLNTVKLIFQGNSHSIYETTSICRLLPDAKRVSVSCGVSANHFSATEQSTVERHLILART